jgi:LemA protein
MIVLLVSVAVLAILAFYGIAIYNELTRERVLVEEGWSGTGTYLQQRNDLIPNLVETVKGYAGHENKTLVEVVKWRNRSAAATTIGEQNQATTGLNQSMMDFFSLTEQYPDLKANTNFQQLQQDLNTMEEKINQSRRYYNATVREFNQSIAVFPKNIVAMAFGFEAFEFFKEDVSAHTAPKVSFS